MSLEDAFAAIEASRTHKYLSTSPFVFVKYDGIHHWKLWKDVYGNEHAMIVDPPKEHIDTSDTS